MRHAAWNRHARALRLPPWQIALVLVLALAIGIAVALVATGVFLIALPIAVLAALAYRLFGGQLHRRRRQRGAGAVIDADYEVIDEARHSRERSRDPH